SLRAREALSVAFVDVDHLKQVNDTLGHAAGDRLLQHVADALRSRLRSYDLVVRYGDDEFICVMPGLTAETATDRLATINRVLRAMSQSGSMSIGVAELQPGDSVEEVVRRADESLYRARGARR
ncbi:MAG: GGDEF domain-containing protein, partial [Actinobacteria bacterium]|nr:GGDEF domain-containing protein [Actinomycetota bacterium]